MSKANILPDHFINRELSWLEFNARVLEEAQDASTPLLERVKFLSIFSSNLDEFFMVRVAGLREQAFSAGTAQDASSDEMKPMEQLRQICCETRAQVAAQYACLTDEILPQLQDEGIRIVGREEGGRIKELDEFFRETVFPVLTPMAIDPSHPRPRYHNRGLYLAAMLNRRTGLGPKEMFAVVHIPQVLPRLVPVPTKSGQAFIFLEELVAARLPELFGGFDVAARACFRVTRDSDIEIIEQESDDMLRLIEERLRARRRADAVRLEISADAEDDLVAMLVAQEQLVDNLQSNQYTEAYRVPGPVDLTGLMMMLNLVDRDDLRDRPFAPQLPRGLRRGSGSELFTTIANRDIFLHHPYDSFTPVVEFIEHAAEDPQVLAIKQTLYRTSGDSPIVRSLISAAEDGKHVTALVELKARFDEEANVSWARQMERAGVHVVYGFLDLKTHCKVSLVVRQEDAGLKRYVHLGTGNYNPTTARIYTDTGIFTSDEAIADDVSALFNLLTGYSQGHSWNKLIVAPEDLHRRTIALIEEQTHLAEAEQPSRIFAKLNSLVDRRTIEALYKASQAGVPIELVIRGICSLRPQIKGLSDNIRVTSIVDRFLEHSRILVFGKDDPQIFMSSADWMPRNFYRRVEVMFPVEAPTLKARILEEIVEAYLKDNVKARELCSDGSYRRVEIAEGETPYRVQEEFLKLHLAMLPKQTPGSNDGKGMPHTPGDNGAVQS